MRQGSGTAAAVATAAIAVLLLTGCEPGGKPQAAKPMRFKFTITVSDDGIEKSASTVIEAGEYAEYIRWGKSSGWHLTPYNKGTGVILDLGHKGWLIVPRHPIKLTKIAETGLSLEEGAALNRQPIEAKPYHGGGIISAIFNSARPRVPTNRTPERLANIPNHFTLAHSHYPRFLYISAAEPRLWDALPLLSTEFNRIAGYVTLVSLTIEHTAEAPADRFDPAPPWLTDVRKLRGSGGKKPSDRYWFWDHSTVERT